MTDLEILAAEIVALTRTIEIKDEQLRRMGSDLNRALKEVAAYKGRKRSDDWVERDFTDIRHGVWEASNILRSKRG